MGMRLCLCGNTRSVSRNAQGTISDGMRLCQRRNARSVGRNAQGTISNGNETLSIQIRTLCEQKRTEDHQRWESDSVDPDTHDL